MARDFKGERNWWLDHFYQWASDARRRSKSPQMRAHDYFAIPIPQNMPTPLAWPCLIWRWALNGAGYGNFKGRGAHVVAYEQSRGKEVSPGLYILHLCHRPFCVQPAHLYEGTANQNSEDKKAVYSELCTYRTWQLLSDRWDRAESDYYWVAPPIETAIPGFRSRPVLKCPHWFVRPAGSATLCANCGEASSESIFSGHREPCYSPSPDIPPRQCRCLTEPCSCTTCLAMPSGRVNAFAKMAATRL